MTELSPQAQAVLDAADSAFDQAGTTRQGIAAALAQPEPQGPMPEADDILRLAAIIRRADGNHDKGAAALAEAILSHPDSRWQHAQPEPQAPTVMQILALCDEIEAEELGTIDLVRRALARYGRPAIEPVP